MINPNDVFKNLKGRENPNNEIFSSLEDEIQKGLQGANEGIPIGFPNWPRTFSAKLILPCASNEKIMK